MPTKPAKPVSDEAWVAATVVALRTPEIDSWTGRIHVHKVLFLVDVLGLAKPPFRFELHQYGPYSFDLDRDIAMMEAFGQLNVEYTKPGYGPRYQITKAGLSLDSELPQRDRDAISRVVDEVGNKDSKQLELLATCLWVTKRENVKDDDRAIDAVRRIKPRYSDEDIRKSLQQAKKMESKLKAA